MNRNARNEVCRIAQSLGVSPVPEDWHGIDAVLHLLERMRQDGAIVIIKLDGGRVEGRDNGPYTFVVSNGPLRDDYIRLDTDSIDAGLAYVISEFDRKVWSA